MPEAASTAGRAGITDEGMSKLASLAFSLDRESSELVDRRHKAAVLCGETLLRGQAAALADHVQKMMAAPENNDEVLTMHRSWDDFSLRMYVNPKMMEHCRDPQ